MVPGREQRASGQWQWTPDEVARDAEVATKLIVKSVSGETAGKGRNSTCTEKAEPGVKRCNGRLFDTSLQIDHPAGTADTRIPCDIAVHVIVNSTRNSSARERPEGYVKKQARSRTTESSHTDASFPRIITTVPLTTQPGSQIIGSSSWKSRDLHCAGTGSTIIKLFKYFLFDTGLPTSSQQAPPGNIDAAMFLTVMRTPVLASWMCDLTT